MGLCVRWLRGLALSCVVLGGVLVAAGAATIAFSGVAVAQASHSIMVEGNRRVEASTIRSYFKPGPGGRLGPEQIDQAIKALYATGLFSDVRIHHARGRLVVSVVENPVINQVVFEGNHKAKDQQLEAEVQSKARGTLSKPTVQADVQRIIQVYHRTGYYDVTVIPQIIDLPNNRVNLVFKIDEGKKTVVREIRFVGTHAFGDNRLKRVIKTTEANWLSFLQTTDIYDPDRVEADRDLLRRFYLKHGYADVRVVSAVGVYDPAKKGFVITFTIDEGPQYHVGKVEVLSNVHALDPNTLRNEVKIHSGDIYNADLVQKSVEAMTIEAAKNGYAFANVRPRGHRDFKRRLINLAFVVQEGRRAYIERINIHVNTRTRGYVIRREFDIGEGDPYNRALIDRAERRLKNLNFFKSVKITNEPGSAPDRVIINVNVVEKPTGSFSISGGYSTADGFIARVSIADRNLLGRGQFAKASVSYGQYSQGFDLSFVEPYLLGYRMAGGIDVFGKQNQSTSFVSYNSNTLGVNLRLGFALTEELALQPHYSIYRQDISLPDQNNCYPASSTCYPASLPVRLELAQGPVTVSMAGYTLTYNTLDNVNSPSSGLYATAKQDFAGLGGDVNFIRTTGEMRDYYEVLPDVVGVLKLQGGNVAGWGGDDLRMLDHFFMGPNLVRGFAPSGIGPRDLTSGTTNDALGGSLYWGASLEFQTPLTFLPREIGIKLAAYADAGNLWDYQGPTAGSAPPGTPYQSVLVGLDGASDIRSSVGVGLIWDSPLGPLRFDLAYPLTKYCSTLGGTQVCDKTQIFRFSGGTKF
ncbi:MAG: outer membrane protein assembly factor BamA [Pseudolabrys sp.]